MNRKDEIALKVLGLGVVVLWAVCISLMVLSKFNHAMLAGMAGMQCVIAGLIITRT